jgi:hypothetical protein
MQALKSFSAYIPPPVYSAKLFAILIFFIEQKFMQFSGKLFFTFNFYY